MPETKRTNLHEKYDYPEENLALCLMFRGERMKWSCRDTDRQIGITWDGAFELDGKGFVVTTEQPVIGARVIAGYPVDDLRAQLERAQSLRNRPANPP